MFCSPSNDNRDIVQSYPFSFGWGCGPVSPAIINDWKTWSAKQTFTDGYTEDPRLSGSVWSYNAYDPNNKGNILIGDRKLDQNEPDYTVSYRYYEQTGYFQKKYINIGAWDDESDSYKNSFALVENPGVTAQTSAQLVQTPDLIHIRFADVLLMHSELTGTADGLNAVRARAGLDPVSYSLDNIIAERRFEFAGEGIRFQDLRRWSGKNGGENCMAAQALQKQEGTRVNYTGTWTKMYHASSSWSKRYAETDGFLMIPPTQILNYNDENILKQNAGWGASVASANMTGTPNYTQPKEQ